MRLIDEDLLIQDLHHGIFDDCDCKKDYEYLGIDDYIRNQPTAFNLESVIDTFEKYKLQQSENEMLSDNGKWLAQRVIEECGKILKSAANATNGGI